MSNTLKVIYWSFVLLLLKIVCPFYGHERFCCVVFLCCCCLFLLMLKIFVILCKFWMSPMSEVVVWMRTVA